MLYLHRINKVTSSLLLVIVLVNMVVAQKFTHVLADGPGSFSRTYIYNESYYTGMYLEGRAAEAAAYVNKKLGNTSLKMLQGVWGYTKDIVVSLGLEAVDKAESLHPGTIEGIVATRASKPCSIHDAYHVVQFYRVVQNRFPAIKFGALWNYEKLLSDINEENASGKTNGIFTKFLNESAFIICYNENVEGSVFEIVSKNLLDVREKMLSINPNVSVMLLTQWPKDESNKLEHQKEFRTFWESSNKWAQEHQFPVYLDVAIDNPNRKNFGYAWWALSDNAKIGEVTGYVEQVPDPVPPPFPVITLVICVAAFIVFISFVVLLYFYFETFLKYVFPNTFNLSKVVVDFLDGYDGNTLLQKGHLEALRVPFNTIIEIMKKDILIDRSTVLECDSFWYICKAEILLEEKSITVDLKITNTNPSVQDIQEMLDDLKILSYLGVHSNILSLRGAYTKELLSRMMYIALDYCPLGTLSNYLRQNRNLQQSCTLESVPENTPDWNNEANSESGSIETQQMVLWSCQIATGMEYLEGKMIVNGSLSAATIYLDINKTAKVSGFNLNRRKAECDEFIKTGKQPAMWQWQAVESLKQGEFSHMSDVWSFGVTLWEIFSLGRTPYEDVEWSPEFTNELENGKRLQCPPCGSTEMYVNTCQNKGYNSMTNCWNLIPDERRKFAKIRQIIQSVFDSSKIGNIAEVDI